jgi:N-acetyl-gamma-glutamyl-phosphate reductase
MGHKHLPEMQAYAGLAHQPVFSPSVIPAHRGMVVDVPLLLAALPGAPSTEALHGALTTFYAGCEVISVAPLEDAPGELLLRKGAEPWDGLRLHVFASADGAQARLVAVLDNLGKGASGAAIQSLNIMCGFPETTGLQLGTIVPA